MPEEQEISEEGDAEISCETIKDSLASKNEEIAYLEELKKVHDDPSIIEPLDEYIQTCKKQLDLIKKISKNACGVQ